MENEIPFGKFQPWKRAFLFPMFPGIFQWDEPTKRFPFSTEASGKKRPQSLSQEKLKTTVMQNFGG